MEHLQTTKIFYKNDCVELSRFDKGSKRYYISNGCTPLGFAQTYEEALDIFNKKVKQLKARRTRKLNKDIAFIKKEMDSIDFENVIEVFHRDYYIDEATTRKMFNK